MDHTLPVRIILLHGFIKTRSTGAARLHVVGIMVLCIHRMQLSLIRLELLPHWPAREWVHTVIHL